MDTEASGWGLSRAWRGDSKFPVPSCINQTPTGMDGRSAEELSTGQSAKAQVREHRPEGSPVQPSRPTWGCVCGGTTPRLNTERSPFPDLRTHSRLLHLEKTQIFNKFMFEIPKSIRQFSYICESKPLKIPKKRDVKRSRCIFMPYPHKWQEHWLI